MAACNCGQWPTGLRTSGRGTLLSSSKSAGPSKLKEMALEEYRSEFPVTKNLIWLNHAAIAPLVRPAAEAMIRFSEDARDFSSMHYDEWLGTYEALRKVTARLINSKP